MSFGIRSEQEQLGHGLHARSKTYHCLLQTTANSIRYQSLVPSACHAEASAKVRQRTNPPWRTTLNKRLSTVPRELLVHYLDLLVYYSPGKAIDRDVHPVVLFPFNNKIVLKIACIGFEMT